MLRAGVVAAVLCLAVAATACGSSSKSSTGTATSRSTPNTSTSQPSAATTSTVAAASAHGVCGSNAAPPRRYQSVVVFSFENRTWSAVGLGFTKDMPYLHGLAMQCSYFTTWNETDAGQNSLTQYVGQMTGNYQPGTINDCSPSPQCSTQADNVFRQARRAGVQAINYVEGATKSCDAATAHDNAPKHIPALYMWGADDRAHCDEQVRPYTEFDPSHPPAFAFITPTLCDDGHDCDNATVDRWARTNVQPVLDSAAYRDGKVAVFIWYDEDRPVANMWITPTAHAGAIELDGAGAAGTLSAWESMLGFPCLASACHTVDMRTAAHS